MDAGTERRRVGSARVGHLGTVSPDGAPHLVPVCFALVEDVIYHCVDGKPKRSRQLRRVANIQATGQACLVVDEYDEDWTKLWWIRLDGRGRLVDDAGEGASALAALAEKYPQYVEQPPTGPVIALDVTRWSSWAAQ